MSSPAIEPNISGRFNTSSAKPTLFACPGLVFTTPTFPENSIEIIPLRTSWI